MATTERNFLRTAITNAPGTTGDFLIGAAVSSYRTFGVEDDSLYFSIGIKDGTSREVRKDCQYDHDTLTLTRGTLADSSTGSAINLTSAAVLTVTDIAGGVLVASTMQGVAAYEYATGVDMTCAPAGGTTTLAIANFNRLTYKGTGNISGAGHPIGAYGSVVMNAPTYTSALSIGVEGAIDNQNGTTALGVGVVGTLIDNAAAKTVNSFTAFMAQINDNHGTIDRLSAFRATIPRNNGTITKYVAIDIEGIGAVTGITRKLALENNNLGMPITSKSAICDASLGLFVPVTGETSVLLRDVSTVLFVPAGSIATHTITWPADSEDGQKITLFTSQTITTLSHTAGPALYGAPSTLVSGTWFSMRYFISLSGWVRVG